MIIQICISFMYLSSMYTKDEHQLEKKQHNEQQTNQPFPSKLTIDRSRKY